MFYRAIDDMFGFIPNNIELYKLALIHKSASVTLDNGQHINNERLEFLGDAVIESVSSDYLFIEFPDKNEGFLTQLRSKMVSRQALNGVARRIGLDDHVITNSTNNSIQKHIYGDAFEAMMGAIYLDQGYDFVNRLLINKIFARYMKLETLLESETDFKSRLIEWSQKNHHTIQFITSYDKSSSSAHPYFYSKVMIDNIEVGYGVGESKKEAEQRAAHSVSLGFSDSDYTKLMDKLDNIDANQRPSEPRRNDKPKAAKQKEEPKEPKEPKESKEPKPKSEPKVKAEPKAKSEPKKREDVKSKAKAEKAAEAEADQPSAEQKHSEQAQAEEQTTTEEKPKRRSRRSAKPKEATPVTAEKATEEMPTDTTAQDNAADEEKPKSRSRSRRRRSSQERPEQNTSEQDNPEQNKSIKEKPEQNAPEQE